MKIFNKEKKDGLSDAMISAPAIVTSEAKIAKSANDLDKLIASINSVEDLVGIDQPDLAVIVSVLVSAGWNLNDDVFSKEELWRSKDTPRHKPINSDHNSDTILGHMIHSKAIDKNGEDILLNENDAIPDEFDIEVAGVLYKQLLGEKVNKVLEDINNGNMFVSMECWFDDFAYAFKNPKNGDTKILDRDEKTSFLTKYLRSYGGKGEYQGYKIGRVLKNIVFGGQGLVKNPANPRSIIKLAANMSEDNTNNTGGNEMDNDIKKQLEEAISNIASKDETIKKLTDQIASVSNDFASKEKSINEKIESLQKDLDSTKEALVLSEKQRNETVANLDKVTKELDNIKQLEKAQKRFEELSKVKNIASNEKDDIVKELCAMSDEVFASVLKYANMNAIQAKASDESKDSLSDSLETATENSDDKGDFNVAGDNEQEKEEDIALGLARLLFNVDDSDNENKDSKNGE